MSVVRYFIDPLLIPLLTNKIDVATM